MKRLVIALSALLLLVAAEPIAHAQVVKPAGVPTVVVPGYGQTISVFAYTIAGYNMGVGVFVQQGASWQGVLTSAGAGTAGNGRASANPADIQNEITAAGGATNWLNASGARQQINLILSLAFPPMNGTPLPQPTSGDPVDNVNYSLSTAFQFVLQNGVPVIVAK